MNTISFSRGSDGFHGFPGRPSSVMWTPWKTYRRASSRKFSTPFVRNRSLPVACTSRLSHVERDRIEFARLTDGNTTDALVVLVFMIGKNVGIDRQDVGEIERADV